MCDNLEEIKVNIGQVKAMLKYLKEITPRCGFHDAVDWSMQGAYRLAASIKNLDHNTGYASQVPILRKVHQPTYQPPKNQLQGQQSRLKLVKLLKKVSPH